MLCRNALWVTVLLGMFAAGVAAEKSVVAGAEGQVRIRCAASWYRRNLKGEAVGSIVHEMVHVVQQYGRSRRANPNATRTPGWLTEGITDYIRWYHYEPESRGAGGLALRILS